MRIALAIGLILLAGCSTAARQPAANSAQADIALISCTEPRPELCTMEYAPACATLKAGGEREYASGCSACSDDVVAGYRPGPCAQ